MTDEERQKLCDYLNHLRVPQICFSSDGEEIEHMVKIAADEIERLWARIDELEKALGHRAERWPG